MKIKDGVILAGLNEVMRPVLIAADRIWQQHGQPLVVTCGLNGVHSAGSLHYYGKALDFRTRDFSAYDKLLVADELEAALGLNYDVIVHKTHIHVEYDPKD